MNIVMMRNKTYRSWSGGSVYPWPASRSGSAVRGRSSSSSGSRTGSFSVSWGRAKYHEAERSFSYEVTDIWSLLST